MSKYIKLFDTHSEYLQYMRQYGILPNVSKCITENHVHYNPLAMFNGYEYVDLGLPSGLIWAKCNVGASTETGYGLYFSWGGTTGYADATSGKSFTWADYELGNGGETAADMLKYNSTDGKTVLGLENDAAHIIMGGSWRMPTKEECDELLNTEYVTHSWVTNYNGSGINGGLFTSLVNGKKLFFPASGYIENGVLNYTSLAGNSWCSTISSDNLVESYDLYYSPDNFDVESENDARCLGQTIRGVILL